MALLRKFDEGGTTQDTEQQTEQDVELPVTETVVQQSTGNVKPQTILIYGEDYDVNTLERAIYSGANDYLKGWRLGQKHRQEFFDALDLIWNGMKELMNDGNRIVYKGSHFTDYKGEITNNKKAKKDWIGYAAKYLSEVFDNATPIEKPKSYDYAPWLVGSVVLRRIFGTSAGDGVGSGSLDDWFFMDELGEDNIRGTSKRAKRFKEVLEEVLKDSHAFDEYNWSPENIERARGALNNAIKALEDGLDPADYSVFATNLGRFGTGAQGWNTLFIGDTRTPAELAQEKEEQQKKQEEEQKIADQWLFIPDDDNPEGIRIQKGDSFEQNFNSWLNKKYPKNTNLNEITISKETSKKIGEKSNIITSILLRSNTNYISNALVKEMHGQASNLGNALRNAGIDRNIILPILIGWLYLFGNKEKINNDFWYLKDVVLPNNGVLFYNPTTGLVQSRSLHDVPSWMEARRNEFEDKLYQMGISINKQGGILTFKKGGEVGKYQNPANPLGLPEGGYEDIWKLLKEKREPWFNAETGEAYSKRLQHLYSDNTGLIRKDRANNATNAENPDTAEYDYGAGGAQIEGQDWWKNWGEILTGNKDLAEHWAREYAKYSPKSETTGKTYYSGWFEGDDFEKGKFNFENFKKSSKLWSDAKNSIGHDIYRAMVYAIKEPGNKITYYSGPLEGFENYGDLDTSHGLYDVQYLTRSAAPPETTTTPAADVTPAPDTEVTGEEEVPEGDGGDGDGGEETQIRTRAKRLKNFFSGLKNGTSKYSILGEYPSDLLGIARMFTHLHGSRKATKLLLKGYSVPYIPEQKHYYSALYGDYPGMSEGQREAGQIITNMFNNQTADAANNSANMLEAFDKAAQKNIAAANLDNAIRRETAKEALANTQKTMESGIDAANQGYENIIKTGQDIAKIRATETQKNTETIANWLSEMQKNWHARTQERTGLVREAKNMSSYMLYGNELDKLEAELSKNYKDDKGNVDYTKMHESKEYRDAVRAIYNMYQMNLIENALNTRWYSPYRSYKLSARQGGKLIKRKRR